MTDKKIESSFDLLNDNQKAFVLNYIKYRVATTAYLEAYSNDENPLDYQSAGASATRLLKDVRISNAIKEKITEIWNNKEKEIGNIFDEFISLGFSDFKNLLEYKDGNLALKDFEAIDTRCIKKIKIREDQSKSTKEILSTVTEIELHDKRGSLAELADILNLKKQQIEILNNPVQITIEGVKPESTDPSETDTDIQE